MSGETSEPHTVSERLSPEQLAHHFVTRPEMFMGRPVTLERAIAFARGIETGLAVVGDYRPQPGAFDAGSEPRSSEQEREAIRELLPQLTELFAAAQGFGSGGEG